MFRLNTRGFTLLETLVAVAIAGVVVSAIATVYVAMKDNLIRDQAAFQAESLRAQVAGIMAQPALCSKAMVAGGGNVTWAAGAPRSNGITAIRAVDVNGVNGNLPIAIGHYSQYLDITAMYLRRPLNTPQYTEVAATAPVQWNSRLDQGILGSPTLEIIPAKLVIETAPRSLGPPLAANRAKVIDVTVGVNATTREVVICAHAMRAYNPRLYTCNNTTVNPGSACPFSPKCYTWYFIAGFDSAGVADCRCALNCTANALADVIAIKGGP